MRNWYVTLSIFNSHNHVAGHISRVILAKTPGEALTAALVRAVTDGVDETAIKLMTVGTVS
jgi:hypothetical protein